MSASAATLDFATATDERTRSILRWTIGVTIACTLAYGVAWPLSYLTPILASVVLVPGGKAVTPKIAVAFLVIVAIGSLCGLVLSVALLPYKLAFIVMIAWLLLAVFYMGTGTMPRVVSTWLLLSITLIPLLALTSGLVAQLVAWYLFVGVGMAMGCALVATALFPHPPSEAPTDKPEPRPTEERLISAIKSTVVLYPLLLVFLFFSLAEQAVVLVFAALLAQNPSLGAGKKAGVAIIAANVGGGLMAVVIYNLLVTVPEFYYLLLLIFLTGMLMGQFATSESKFAKLGGMTFNTVLLVVGSTTTSTTDAGSKVFTRVLQITSAVLYLVIAFALIERFAASRRARNA